MRARVFAVLLGTLLAAGCGDDNATTGSGGMGGSSGSGGMSGTGGAGAECGAVGQTCTMTSDCCMPENCDTTVHMCKGPVNCHAPGDACTMASDCCNWPGGGPGVCGSDSKCQGPPNCTAQGGSCTVDTQCCSVRCVNGTCGTQCTNDGQSCQNDDNCCSRKCMGGTCAALNPSCLSFGNACTSGSQCCSTYCASGICGHPSFCALTGDACANASECCSGSCVMTSGLLGTCGAAPSGSSNCSGQEDGVLCSSCNACCSRLCAPYTLTGVLVCQPAEGCRVDGDLCQRDTDCCGGDPSSGLPGAGNVVCSKANPTDLVGLCRNPNSCNPEGNVCHFKNYACSGSSARNDCCAAPGNSGVCQLDPLGVPRCYGLGTMCRMVGDTCASSADCCNGLPCVADSNGVLHCGSMCSMAGQTCTADADCCTGLICNIPPGSTRGTCGGPPTPDGGTTDGGMCSQYGQMCNASQPCCSGLDCDIIVNNQLMPCPAGQTTGCTCLRIVP